MVMVQEPDTAKYGGMPKSAIETGLVDFILPVEKMPEYLVRYVKHPVIKKNRQDRFGFNRQRVPVSENIRTDPECHGT